MNKARILIVEDEAIIAMELESQLQSLGYEVTAIVNSGEKTIDKAEADKPDLILMDIRIKGEMDGIDVAEIIRNRFGIPVIFSTAYLDHERIERAKITMPFGYVLKPIQERDLRITLEMALYVAKVDKERRKAEEELSDSRNRAHRQGNAIAQLAVNDAIAMGDVPTAMRKLMEVITEITQVERASVWLFSENSVEMACIALFEARSKKFSDGAVLKVTDYPRYFDAIHTNSRVCANDAQSDPQTSEFTEGYLKPLGITSMLDAGIHVKGRLIGVICLEHTEGKRIWHPEEESFASSIAALVAQTFGNADRKHAEEALKMSETHLQGIINSISHPFHVIALKTRIIKHASKATGGDAVGKTCYSATHNSSVPCNTKDHPCPIDIILKTKKPLVVEHFHYHSDGSEKMVEIHASPLFDDDGEVEYIVESNIDITERR